MLQAHRTSAEQQNAAGSKAEPAEVSGPGANPCRLDECWNRRCLYAAANVAVCPSPSLLAVTLSMKRRNDFSL